MSNAVPDPYEWNSTFKVDYKNIDDEHKEIFAGILACEKDPSNGAKLAKLIKVTVDHFDDEEGMMSKASKYTSFDMHKKVHADFVTTLKGLACPIAPASIETAKKWLVNHIKDIDFKYKGML